MRTLVAVLAAVAALCAGAAVAADAAVTSSAPVCQEGPQGSHSAGLDEDGDGVPDSEDWCAHTPRGARVGSNGCAKGEVAVNCAVAMPEPQEPPAQVVPVAEPPAPPPPWENKVAVAAPDSDGDGVPDADDKCAGTPQGAAVDKNGCVVIEKVVLKGVNFATGSHKLLPAASATLKSVASAMKANKDLEVEVDGYTDGVGDAAKNLKLSERRAKSVKDFLVKDGVEAKRLSTKGFGKADPVDTNDTPAGRANNRRVAFKVTRS